MTEDDEDFADQDDFKDLEDILNQKLEMNLEITTKLSKNIHPLKIQTKSSKNRRNYCYRKKTRLKTTKKNFSY